MRLGLENQFRTRRQRARVSDMDQTCVSPYGPAAYEKPQSEAGHTTAPDHMTKPTKKRLAFPGASTHAHMATHPQRNSKTAARQSG
ncbi:MAG: hypothetical protein GY761_12250 [Hyphomicrobiales bacterium]|nr:hypothetical protein [Hyphomicrobiales bacterium]